MVRCTKQSYCYHPVFDRFLLTTCTKVSKSLPNATITRFIAFLNISTYSYV